MISVTTIAAKVKNAVRRPRVAMLIPTAAGQLTIYGLAEATARSRASSPATAGCAKRLGRPVEASDEEFGTSSSTAPA